MVLVEILSQWWSSYMVSCIYRIDIDVELQAACSIVQQHIESGDTSANSKVVCIVIVKCIILKTWDCAWMYNVLVVMFEITIPAVFILRLPKTVFHMQVTGWCVVVRLVDCVLLDVLVIDLSIH